MNTAHPIDHAARMWTTARGSTVRLWTDRIPLASIAAVGGWVVIVAALSAVLLSVVTWAGGNWAVRAAVLGLATLAAIRPPAAFLVTAALLGFGPILSYLAGSPSVRANEVLVAATLWGCYVRAVPGRTRYGRALMAEISSPLVLFAATVVASTLVWLRVQQVETAYAPAFVRSLLLVVSRTYFTDPRDFGVIVSTAVFLEGIGLYVAVRMLCRIERPFFERALRMFALGGAGLAVMSVLRLAEIHLRNPGAISLLRSTPNGLRISPQIPDPIAAAAYFALCWLITLGFALSSPRRRFHWLAAGLPLIAGLYLTGSRSAIAAMLAGVLVCVFLVARRTASARSVLAVALVTLGIMVASYQAGIGRDMAGTMAARSLQVRLELARTSTRIIAMRPLFGVGIDRYHLWSGPLASPELQAMFPARKNPHNDFIRVAAELGLVGAAFFVWLLAGAIRDVWRGLRFTRDTRLGTLAAGLVAFGVTSLVSNPLMVPEVSYAFWIALGLAAGKAWQVQSARNGLVVSTDPMSVEHEGVRSFPPRRAVAVLLALMVAVSIPFRADSELAAVDLEHVSYGFFPWDRDSSGRPFRWSGKQSTVFVDERSSVIEIPVAGVPSDAGPDLHLEIRLNGQLANRMIVGREWQRVRFLVPPGPPGRPHRIDLLVSPTWVPAETLPRNVDRRVLGVKVGQITSIAAEGR